ncbi:preprotein translocase subunit SecG [bacterium]|nr:preprotein translocase subunit SecG [bacterium]
MVTGSVHNFVLGVHILVSVGLIVLVIMQTQREQGIMGLFGQGSAPTKTRGLGTEEILKVWTKKLAVTYFITSIFLLWAQSYV